MQQPKLLSSAAAVYPPLARAQGVQGDVTIDALIDANGKVSATNVLTGNPLLQKAAVDAVEALEISAGEVKWRAHSHSHQCDHRFPFEVDKNAAELASRKL